MIIDPFHYFKDKKMWLSDNYCEMAEMLSLYIILPQLFFFLFLLAREVDFC